MRRRRIFQATLLLVIGCGGDDKSTGLGSPGNERVVTGDVALALQADLDSLTTLMGDESTIITGNQTIRNADDLGDLAGLSGLKRVGGNLEVADCDSLLSMLGLESLETVVGSLSIRANGALADLDHLTSLRRVGTTLEISANQSLVTIDGLSALTEVGTGIDISDNGLLGNAAARARRRWLCRCLDDRGKRRLGSLEEAFDGSGDGHTILPVEMERIDHEPCLFEHAMAYVDRWLAFSQVTTHLHRTRTNGGLVDFDNQLRQALSLGVLLQPTAHSSIGELVGDRAE